MIIDAKNACEAASEYAYRILHKNIIKMILLPGSAISPVELSNELNISRTPIQRACSRLATEGLLTVVPQKGSYVSYIDLQRVYESVYMRNILDQTAVRYLCTSPRLDEALQSLQLNLEKQKFSVKNRLIEDVMLLDNQFHDIIYSYCEMNNIRRAMAGISADQDRVRQMKMRSEIRLHETINEHESLLQAIRERDAEKASLLSYEHVARFGVDINSVYNENPSFFRNWDENLTKQFVCKREFIYNMQKQ